MPDYNAELEALRQQGLLRERRVLDSAQGPEIVVDGRSMLAFCSNDYLGLASHPGVTEAFTQAAREYGVGSGASHMVNGHHRLHHELEQAVAAHTGRESAALFSTGYMANLGVIAALAGRHDVILQDRLNHASLLDGAHLAGARLKRYTHADTQAAARMLEGESRCALVATDGVFSMDGDLAPLDGLSALCHEQGVPLMVDDAHGLGVLGSNGGGIAEVRGLGQSAVPILVGTLGKSLGVGGAFVAGSRAFVDYLVQKARTYIYTTAMPPAMAAATQRSLELCREESWRRERLAKLVAWFRDEAMALGYRLLESWTPIQPLIVGPSDRAMALSEALARRDILVPAIRPPTVPQGEARLRFTFSAAHTDEHMERLLEALKEARSETGAA
ncbi:8-amino-7-oxononanoate synthase [Salicola sp. Rm-C-2C1-2]|uniref:8-amino-7-oxononanoate synthase n=1 Tax=Salicola sp. Rm-C-2C1-2 TaxID=3141321 RepID=UPI0032E429AE